MPRPSTGYEVVRAPITSDPQHFDAPVDTFIVSVFIRGDVGGQPWQPAHANGDYRFDFDSENRITGVEVSGISAETNDTLTLVCVGA